MSLADEHRRRISTSTLNLVLSDAAAWRQPPTDGRGRRGRIYYGTQAGARPPTFVLFCNDPSLFSEDYRKFIERQVVHWDCRVHSFSCLPGLQLVCKLCVCSQCAKAALLCLALSRELLG